MRNSQRGITLLGWVVLLVPIAILVYAGIRLTPIYLNYFHVVKALEQTASESKGETVNPVEVHQSLERRFNVEYVEVPDAKEIDVHRDGDRWVAEAKYEQVAPLFGNLSLLVEFDKVVEFNKGAESK
jgi:hypothetical protein